MLGAVRMRKLKTRREDLFGLRGHTLETAIIEDLANGLIPFFVSAGQPIITICKRVMVESGNPTGITAFRKICYMH